MKIEQNRWTKASGWEKKLAEKLENSAQLVLLFGGVAVLKEQKRIDDVKKAYPKAQIMGCSTAGEIYGTEITDDSLVLTAVNFEHTNIKTGCAEIEKGKSSFEAGVELAKLLDKKDLSHAFVLSDGLAINGSELAKGLSSILPENVSITGGLSGDAANFKETLVFCEKEPKSNVVSILGFYGNRLKIGYGSMGGWDAFGPYRLITRSKGNVLYEIDGKSALDLYKMYLGDQASGLPATGLLFPLDIRIKEGDRGVVRTILAVNEKEKSMTFAGDIPEGAQARFMKANFDRLIDGSIGAAKVSKEILGGTKADLAVLVSCVGRKLVLKQRTEEEVEAVREILGEQAAITGFYSYGEIAPFAAGEKCALHNQTMTITAFAEK